MFLTLTSSRMMAVKGASWPESGSATVSDGSGRRLRSL